MYVIVWSNVLKNAYKILTAYEELFYIPSIN